MFGLSQQHTKFMTSLKCPLCDERIPGAKARLADGRETRSLERLYLMSKGRTAVMVCPDCQGEWPVFASEAPAARNPAPVRLRETERVKEAFSEDTRELDNRGGSTTTTQTMSVSEQWTQTMQIDVERTETTQNTGTIGVDQVASISTQVEEELKRSYSITDTHQRTHSEELTIEVPPHTLRHLDLRYKRILQKGVAEVPMDDGSVLEVPFKVALNLSLDWSQRDEVASS